MTATLLSAVSRNLTLRSQHFGLRPKLSSQNSLAKQVFNQQQRRYLDLQEYQSKQLLHEHGVQVQRFKVVSSVSEAQGVLYPELEVGEHEHEQEQAAAAAAERRDGLGDRKNDALSTNQRSRWAGFEGDLSGAKEFVIKAQVLAGGRGKGHFKRSQLTGGVKLTPHRDEAIYYSQCMLNDHLITKQTSSEGVLVKRVMIAEAVRLRKEFYFAIVLDRSYDCGPIFVTSPNGGMDIEELAASDSSCIRRFTVPIDMELDMDTSRRMVMAAFDLSLHELDVIDQCAREVIKLHKMFLSLDASQVEINPLGVTNESQVVSVDAKIKFDENARFRQSWLDELEALNAQEADDARDLEARKHQLNFIGLDGSIGCLVNGAGLAMATMDIIKLHGGAPANFLDVGGGASAGQVSAALRLIASDPKVRAIFINIFGGIMRCDTIAEGLIEAARSLELSVPVVCRLQGTRVELAKRLLHESGLGIMSCDELDTAAALVVNSARG